MESRTDEGLSLVKPSMHYPFTILCLFGLATVPAYSQVWIDQDKQTQQASWSDPRNWDGGVCPQTPGTIAVVDTPNLAKYLVVQGETVLGELHLSGADAPAGGLLSHEDGTGVLRFDNGAQPGLLECLRPCTEDICVPMEFQRELVIRIGAQPAKKGSKVHPAYAYFGPEVTLSPVGQDPGTLTFQVNSSGAPWAKEKIVERLILNTVQGCIEDGASGGVLSLVKDGPGILSLANADNGYSGTTRVLQGTLCGVNAENIAPPFLSFGRGRDILVEGGEKATLHLRSSQDGTWGLGNGYGIRFTRGGTLLCGSAAPWNRIQPTFNGKLEHRIGSLAVDSGTLTIRLDTGMRLLVPKAGSVQFGPDATGLVIKRPAGFRLDVADVDFECPVSRIGATTPLLVKDVGVLRLHEGNRFDGGLVVRDATLTVTANDALGAGEARFESGSILAIDVAEYQPDGTVVQEPGSAEVWLNSRARLDDDDEGTTVYSMPPGVDLLLPQSIMEAMTLVMNGGSLVPMRMFPEDASPVLLPKGLTLRTTDDFRVDANLNIRFRKVPVTERMGRTLQIQGNIEEMDGPHRLLKSGYGTVMIGGVCNCSGETRIENGTLCVLPSGRLASREIQVLQSNRFSREVLLRLQSPDAIPSGASLTLQGNAKIMLDFEGKIVVSTLTVDGNPVPSGRYNDPAHVSGNGRLVVSSER